MSWASRRAGARVLVDRWAVRTGRIQREVGERSKVLAAHPSRTAGKG